MKKAITVITVGIALMSAGLMVRAGDMSVGKYHTLPAVSGAVVTNQDNGSAGGYALIQVTDEQWNVLRKSGAKPQIFGNVMDTHHPQEHTPLLMDHGFGEEVFLVTYLAADKKGSVVQGMLPEGAPRPKVYWVAVATWRADKTAKN